MDGASDLLYERETTINMTDAEDVARVYTASPSWMRKFDRLCNEQPLLFKAVGDSTESGRVVGRFYEFPKSLVSIRTKKVERNLTDEQRAALSERMKKTRQKQLEARKAAGNGKEA